MDSFYASMKVIKAIEGAHKVYYCPLKRNRQANSGLGNALPTTGYSNLPFDESEEQSGKLVHLKKFPKGHQVKLFRLVSSTGDTEWIVTNDLSDILFQSFASAVRKQTAVRLEDHCSFIANGNKPPEFNVANAENKEPNAITSRPHYWLGPIFIKQQCGPKFVSTLTPSNRDYWMTTFAN